MTIELAAAQVFTYVRASDTDKVNSKGRLKRRPIFV